MKILLLPFMIHQDLIPTKIFEINIEKGLPRIREQWILDRNDVEILDGITSEYGKARLADSKLDNCAFHIIINLK
jgi:hypothetical protein